VLDIDCILHDPFESRQRKYDTNALHFLMAGTNESSVRIYPG
jgi:hypothetical protein